MSATEEPGWTEAKAPGRSPLTVRWVDSLDQVEALREHWSQLESRASDRTIFARWLFRYVWYRNLVHNGEQPLCGGAWSGDRLVGLAPMARSRSRLHGVPVHRVDFSGRQVHQGEFLVDDEHPDAAERLFASLLDDVRPDAGTIIGPEMGSPGLATLAAIASQRGFKFVERPHHHSIVRLDAGYDAYFASLKRTFRRNVRSRARKLERLGATVETFGHGDHDVEAIRGAIDRMVEIVDSSWRAHEGEKMSEQWRAVYEDTAVVFAAEGNLRLDFLVVDGRDAAFFYSLVDEETLYDVTIGYHHDFRHLSPGTVLMQRLLERYADEGIRSVVSQGPYPYKRHWSTGKVNQSDIHFFAPTLRGRLGYLVNAYLMPHVSQWQKRYSRWHNADGR